MPRDAFGLLCSQCLIQATHMVMGRVPGSGQYFVRPWMMSDGRDILLRTDYVVMTGLTLDGDGQSRADTLYQAV